MSLKLLIADDEPLARKRIRRLLVDTDYLVCAEAVNGEQVLELAESFKPDIVLLDIRMPGMDGLTAARQLSRNTRPPAIIFTTAYDEYALAAIQASASAYLMKPIEKDDLLQALARSVVTNQAQLARLGALQSGPSDEHGTDFITVESARGNHRIELADVLYARADSKYVTLRHLSGEAVCDLSLRQLEERYSSHFIRIHRNTLINPAYLKALSRIEEGQYLASLRFADEQLPVSRRLLPQVRSALTGNTD
ncbi:LytR/AlgR family response regulator transcription factor [Allohahella sp. A8]|uniref:LytR/AlgR family response regulator transcription factor n=1 Tax=Allohahella sp. A8 TaxID=3141461 RepID=UPI003A8078EB